MTVHDAGQTCLYAGSPHPSQRRVSLPGARCFDAESSGRFGWCACAVYLRRRFVGRRWTVGSRI